MTTSQSSRAHWLLSGDSNARLVDTPTRFSLDSDAWRVRIESMDIGSGLRVMLTDADARMAAAMEPAVADSEAWFATNIVLRGQSRLVFADGRTATIDATRTLAFHPADKRARYLVDAGQRLRIAGYRISRDRLSGMFGHQVPAPFLRLIEPQHGATHLAEVRTTNLMRRTAQAIFTSGMSGSLRAAYVEGAILQLLALQAHGVGADLGEARNVSMDSVARRKILEARERLLADIRNPPTLHALAAGSGVSEKMLNAGFRALFGATVFETLRNERLEHARLILALEDVPLKLVAARVGYRHASNFITAFAARYGETPGRYANDDDSDEG
jgi:AraC-like DNA-binding protein